MPRGISIEREQFWRRHIAQQQVSQLGIREYCRLHSLPEHSFHSWRRTIAERDRQTATPPASPTPTAPAFLPVTVIDAPTPPNRTTPIDIFLVDGRRLRVRPGCDRQLLADVLSILDPATSAEQRPC
jgi:transposase